MIYFQVEDVNTKFSELVDLEAKNWILEQKPKPKVAPTKKAIVSKPFKPKAKASSNIKAMMAAKRKAAMMANKENENANQQIPEIQWDGSWMSELRETVLPAPDLEGKCSCYPETENHFATTEGK